MTAPAAGPFGREASIRSVVSVAVYGKFVFPPLGLPQEREKRLRGVGSNFGVFLAVQKRRHMEGQDK